MTPAQRKHLKDAQRELGIEGARLGVLGEAGKKVFFENLASMSDADIRSAMRRPALGMPGVAPGSLLESQVGPAWNTVSRLSPEMASRIPNIRHFTEEELSSKHGSSGSAALHIRSGELLIPKWNPQLSPEILWHELVHAEQRERGILQSAPMRTATGALTEHGQLMESEAHQRGNMQAASLIERAKQLAGEDAARPASLLGKSGDVGLSQMAGVLSATSGDASASSKPTAHVRAEPAGIADLIGGSVHQTVAPTGIPLDQSDPASLAASLADPLKQSGGSAGATGSTAKKKRAPRQQNWGRFLGGLGRDIGHIGHAFGSERIAGMGHMLSMAGNIGRFLSRGTSGGASREKSGIESVIAGAGEDVEPLSGAVEDMAGGGLSTESAAATGEQARSRADSDSVLKDLLDAIKKLTEEMQKQHRSPGADHMPEGGSFGGIGGAAGGLGGLGEALGLSPGEIQLILTMMRVATMAA